MKSLKIIFAILIMLPLQSIFSAPANKITIDADGHPMALWEKTVANPKGFILFHHGRTWSALPDFDLQVEGEELSMMDSFNKMGYSVWALDARGYGETPRDATGWNTPERAAKDISIVLQWLVKNNGEKTHLWGWSMGSMLGQLTAQKYPENMASLTLFGYPLTLGKHYSEDIQTGKPPSETNTALNAASDFIIPGSISQAAINEYVRHSLEADPVRADWHYLHQYNQLDASKVTVPVLLLQAEFDPLAKTDMHAKAFAAFPNADKQWVVLKGGDHAALFETPRAKMIASSIGFIEWLKK